MNLAVMLTFMVLPHTVQNTYIDARGRHRNVSANNPCWPLTSSVWRPGHAPTSGSSTFHEGGFRVTRIADGRGMGGTKGAVGASHSHR